MKQTLLIILTLIFSPLLAQNKNKAFYEIQNGLRLNVEILRPIKSMIDSNYSAYEFSADVGIKPKLRLSADFGHQQILKQDSIKNSFSYNTSGTYFKIGIDRNFMNFENSVDDIISVGFRYGIGFMEHSVKDAVIFDKYWGNRSFENTEKFTAHWLEMVVGMKTPLYKNISMGWDIRAKLLLANSNTFSSRPYIAGFGQASTTTAMKTALSFHYYLSYRIPFKKKMIWDVPEPKKESKND